MFNIYFEGKYLAKTDSFLCLAKEHYCHNNL